MNQVPNPLTDPPPEEVPLSDAPLVRVIAQIRFPLITSIEKRDFIGPFQEAIRNEYPILRPEQTKGVVLGPKGVVEARSNTIWRFYDTTKDWRVSLAPDFLALETSTYSSRDDFLGRFERVLGSLAEHVNPQVVDRIGVRYIDRVTGDNLGDLSTLVRDEVAGVLGTALSEHAAHSISENIFEFPDGAGRLMARWGLIPAGGTVDPAAVEPLDEPSWLLDVDAFLDTDSRELDVDEVVAVARGFAERIYAFFRWVVKPEFLERYGGSP